MAAVGTVNLHIRNWTLINNHIKNTAIMGIETVHIYKMLNCAIILQENNRSIIIVGSCMFKSSRNGTLT